MAAGMKTIFACDPLSLSCSTDPDDAVKEELPQIFFNNLATWQVDSVVQFYQMKSESLSGSWDKPLKALWIDGDHTYNGVVLDLTLFKEHLVAGAVVCFHDVLHGFDGPIRVFMEQVLLSDDFGDCGLCGSIGWGQFTGGAKVSDHQWKNKLSLYAKLSRIIPFIYKKNKSIAVNEHLRRFYRSLIPHGTIDPVQWLSKRNSMT